jgi:type II secretory pathway component GspD/PulD (secretin)
VAPLSPRTAGSSLLGLPSTGTETAAATTAAKTNSTALKFENTESSIVLMAYAAATGRILIIAPDAPKATITLKSQPDIELTKEEYLEAIEKTLAINGIVLVPDGTKLLRVFAKGKVRTEGIETIIEEPGKPHPEQGRTISQMITFKHLAVAEGQKALEGFKKPDGLFQVFERTNTILVTDTQENINRMLEIVKFIDQPIAITDEVNVRIIKYAKADDIKKRIEELVAESQKQQQAKEEIKSTTSGAPGIIRSPISPITTSILGSRTLPPGLVRPGAPATPSSRMKRSLL